MPPIIPCEIHEENCPHAASAADMAVKKTFAILGVDINDPQQVSKFQEDIRFSGKLRRKTEAGIIPVFIVTLGLIGAAFIAGMRTGN